MGTPSANTQVVRDMYTAMAEQDHVVVRNGLIVSDTPYWDTAVIFRQLGVDPASVGL